MLQWAVCSSSSFNELHVTPGQIITVKPVASRVVRLPNLKAI